VVLKGPPVFQVRRERPAVQDRQGLLEQQAGQVRPGLQDHRAPLGRRVRLGQPGRQVRRAPLVLKVRPVLQDQPEVLVDLVW